MTVFGTTVSARDVEERATRTLQYWFETYLQERELATGRVRGSVARPKAWRIVNEFTDTNLEDATPFIAIVSDGLAEPPTADGRGVMRAVWALGVGVLITASTDDAAQLLVKDIYVPVIRAIMLQKQSLRDWDDPDSEIFSNGVTWIHEGYGDAAFGNAERSLWTATIVFEVAVDGVVTRRGGPVGVADPVVQPGSTWPLPALGNIEFKDLTLDANV